MVLKIGKVCLCIAAMLLLRAQLAFAVEENYNFATSNHSLYSEPTNTQPIALPNDAQNTDAPFISTNVGAGFNVSRGKVSIEKVMPTAEFKFGYNLNPFLQAALSYQYQSVGEYTLTYTRSLRGRSSSFSDETAVSPYESFGHLWAVKLIAAAPNQFLWQIFNFKPFAALGIGSCLWTSGHPFQDLLAIKEPETVALSELGFTVGSGFITSTVGCKFNAFINNMKITSAQIIPYMGLQMHF